MKCVREDEIKVGFWNSYTKEHARKMMELGELGALK